MNDHDPTRAPREQAEPGIGERLHRRITEGIAEAQAEHREIDDATARRIGRALGHIVGRDSALTTFGDTGEGSYETLRDEYLGLYSDEATPSEAREWIDWLGTHLVEHIAGSTGRRFMNEHLPPKLGQVLVPTGVTVGGQPFTIHIPATYGAEAVADLTSTLTELMLDEDQALQAFLSLPDVNAMSGNIMEDFHENYVRAYARIEDAVDELTEIDELEREVQEFAQDRGLYVENVSPDYETLLERTREAYDLVEYGGRIYVFNK